MDDTPNLKLPYIMPAQAQKHVTHNEALSALDCIVQLSVIDRDLSAPPTSPANGARYIVAGSPSGAWSGHTNHVAAWQGDAWVFYTPAEGWVAWVRDEDSLLAWDGSNWVVAGGGGGGGGSVNPVAMVGVNTTADTTNRLSVKSNAVLFSHDDVTPGTGDQRTIVNKSAAGKTASHLFQTGFSGRAEFGLTGDDDFHVKVSSNGSTWFEAMVVDRSTGKVRFPASGSREVLTTNRTYYVRTGGSDSNDGLMTTTAFATIQKAIDTALKLDFNGYTVTIQLADGTYAVGGVIGPGVGITATSKFVIQGNAASPGNVIVSTSSADAFTAVSGGIVTLKDMELRTTGNVYSCVGAEEGGRVEFSNLRFGPARNHIKLWTGSRISAIGNYAIVGSAVRHIYGSQSSFVQTGERTVTLTETPNFSGAFVYSDRGSFVEAYGMTFIGGATGRRYDVSTAGGISTLGGGANYFPGDVAGLIAAPGWYA